jgi:TorA maturation chaperone TorD
MSGAAPIQFHPQVAQEDQARAGYYALLARLYHSGPDAALLDAVVNATADKQSDSELARAWDTFAVAARAMDAEAAQLEYDGVFLGTGKAEVTPYATYYLAESGREKILVRLKALLAEWGLGKRSEAHEPEDHFAALFEVMRHLISGGSDDAALQKQKQFFIQFIAPSYSAFCDAIGAAPTTNFYRVVAKLTRTFLNVETESLKVF